MNQMQPQQNPAVGTATAPDAQKRFGGPQRIQSGRGGAGGGRGGAGGGRGGGGRGGRRDDGRGEREKEFEQRTLELSRVTRVTAGGKRMSFRAALVIGDKKGRVGFGVAKGADVQIAIEKAFRKAKKQLIRVSIINDTIAVPVHQKFGSAELLIKPAPKGTGLKAGGACRVILELAGVPNVVSKILNSSNKINIATATLLALSQLHQYQAARPKPAAEEVKPEAKAVVS